MKSQIAREIDDLKNSPIFGIKKYLRKHGLLKVGTQAPNEVIRCIYEHSKGAGHIYNRSSEILLHNYLNEAI